MGINLEHQLGELNGQLKALIPTLSGMENRLREAEAKAAGAEARYEALRNEFDQYKTETGNAVGILFKKHEISGTQVHLAKAAAKKAQTDVDSFKTRQEGVGKKMWDLVKILLGGGLGAYLTWLLGRKGP